MSGNRLPLLLLASIAPLLFSHSLKASSICDSNPNNLILNCGFETGNLTDWTSHGSGFGVGGTNELWYGSNPPVNSGNDSFVIGGNGAILQSFPVVVGAAYGFSFAYDASTPSTADVLNFGIMYFGSPLLTRTLSGGGSLTDSGFQYVHGTFVVPSADGPASVVFQDVPGGGPNDFQSGSPLFPFLIDDVTVQPLTIASSGSTPEPAALVLCLSGLAGIIVLSRYRRHAGTIEGGALR